MEMDSDEDRSWKVGVQRKRVIRRKVTVEPVLFLVVLSYAVSQTVRLQYIQFQVSRSHNVTSSLFPGESDIVAINGTCQEVNGSNLDNGVEVQNEIQAESSYWVLYYDLVSVPLSLIAVPILGSWSDKVGRKPACLIPCIGMVIYSSVFVVLIYLDVENPLPYLFLAEAVHGATGKVTAVSTACMAYITDITTQRQRTYRLVIMSFVSIFAGALSQIGIGYLLQAVGFGPPFILALIVISITFFYILFVVEETIIHDPHLKFSFKERLRDIYELFKENSFGRRWRLALILVNGMVCTAVVNSTSGVTVLYVMQYPFCWSSIVIGYYIAVSLSINAFGLLVGGKLLTCCLTDLAIAQVAVVSLMVPLMIIAFASTTAVMFMGTLSSVFSFLSIPVFNSKLSKIVAETEEGTAFATAGCLEIVGFFFAPLIFNTIYAETLSTEPGIVFAVMATTLVIPVIITGVLQFKEPKTGYSILPSTE